MLTIFVVDKSAEGRNRLVSLLHKFLQGGYPELDLLPRVNVRPLSIQELRFHESPDICLLGSELIEQEITEVAKLRSLLPHCAIVAQLSEHTSSLSIVEQIARMGVNDTISNDVTPQEFFRKLVLLAKKGPENKASKLIVVDSGKGGVGVTSVVAALGERLLQADKQTALVDFDFETQDLSRFLQAKPFVNEALQLMLEQTRPVTEEFVEQALNLVWSNESALKCMSPAPESEDLYDARSSYSRSFLSIFEVLDSLFEVVLVDAGSARGALLRTLYRVADSVIFVVNNDPATLYASADRLAKARSWMAPAAELFVVENGSSRRGLSSRILRSEFSRAVELDDQNWFSKDIPFCVRAARWPGSGATMASLGRTKMEQAFDQLVVDLRLVSDTKSRKLFSVFSHSKLKSSKQLTSSPIELRDTSAKAIALPTPVESPGDTSSAEPRQQAEVVRLENVIEKPVLSDHDSKVKQTSPELDNLVSGVFLEEQEPPIALEK